MAGVNRYARKIPSPTPPRDNDDGQCFVVWTISDLSDNLELNYQKRVRVLKSLLNQV